MGHLLGLGLTRYLYSVSLEYLVQHATSRIYRTFHISCTKLQSIMSFLLHIQYQCVPGYQPLYQLDNFNFFTYYTISTLSGNTNHLHVHSHFWQAQCSYVLKYAELCILNGGVYFDK